jgi:hypothetical protein
MKQVCNDLGMMLEVAQQARNLLVVRFDVRRSTVGWSKKLMATVCKLAICVRYCTIDREIN